MLILTRKLNETIHIGTDITITVTRISRGQVRLGVVAPRGVVIARRVEPPEVRETRFVPLE